MNLAFAPGFFRFYGLRAVPCAPTFGIKSFHGLERDAQELSAVHLR